LEPAFEFGIEVKSTFTTLGLDWKFRFYRILFYLFTNQINDNITMDLFLSSHTDTVENLKSPLYDIDYLPHEKVFEWVITASSDNVVTLQVHVY
jgi:hypothetical protein